MFSWISSALEYWWPMCLKPTQEVDPNSEEVNTIDNTLNNLNTKEPKPRTKVSSFVEFTQQVYPELSEERVKYLRTKFYKIHRQLVLNRQFRGRHFDWPYLAAKLTGNGYDRLEVDIERNEELWNEVNQFVKLD